VWQVAGHFKHSNYAVRVPCMRGIDQMHVISQLAFYFLATKFLEFEGSHGGHNYVMLCSAVEIYSRFGGAVCLL